MKDYVILYRRVRSDEKPTKRVHIYEENEYLARKKFRRLFRYLELVECTEDKTKVISKGDK